MAVSKRYASLEHLRGFRHRFLATQAQRSAWREWLACGHLFVFELAPRFAAQHAVTNTANLREGPRLNGAPHNGSYEIVIGCIGVWSKSKAVPIAE